MELPKQERAFEPLKTDGHDSSAGASELTKGQKLEVLRITTTSRDDWLHRGLLLLDVTWDCYVQQFERVRKLRDVWRKQDGASFYPFD